MSCSCTRRAALTVPGLLSHSQRHFLSTLCPAHLLWGFSAQFVMQMFNKESQGLVSWPNTKDTAGNFSVMIWFWSPITGRAAKILVLMRGLCSFIKALSACFCLCTVQTHFLCACFFPCTTSLFHSGFSCVKNTFLFLFHFSLNASDFVLFCLCPL